MNKAGVNSEKKRHKSLTSVVYERLREDIITCKIEPATELSEADLAAFFEVSKTPVREALAMLRSDGLVETFPRRGYQVTPITFSDITELFEIRTILESGAADLASQRITDAEIEALRGLVSSGYCPQEQGSLPIFIAMNRKFHLEIARIARNARLYRQLEKQINEMERFFYIGATLRNVNNETNSDHREIVEVLARRKPAEAREVMRRHNEVTRTGLLDALTDSPGVRLLRV